MKTANMPNKVFERRKKALNRLENTKITQNHEEAKKQRIEEEKNVLMDRLNIAGNPKNLKSKKDNSKKAKVRQF